MRRWRKSTWALLVWHALIIVWIVAAGAGSGDSVDECVADSSGLLTRQDCQDAVDAGTGIGVFLILILWFLVTMVLFAVWFASRPRHDEGAAALAEELRLAREAREEGKKAGGLPV